MPNPTSQVNRVATTLPPLPYNYDTLEPFISGATLKLHHGAHHRGYVDKLNALIKGTPLESASLEEIVKRSSGGVFNNAAQAWNHAFFWKSLRAPQDFSGRPSGLAARFADELKAAATGLFGSGWVWLVQESVSVRVVTTGNANTPIAHGQRPLLVIDVWEHAYYLDHQNRRDQYVSGVVDHLLNWEFAERNLLEKDPIHAK